MVDGFAEFTPGCHIANSGDITQRCRSSMDILLQDRKPSYLHVTGSGISTSAAQSGVCGRSYQRQDLGIPGRKVAMQELDWLGCYRGTAEQRSRSSDVPYWRQTPGKAKNKEGWPTGNASGRHQEMLANMEETGHACSQRRDVNRRTARSSIVDAWDPAGPFRLRVSVLGRSGAESVRSRRGPDQGDAPSRMAEIREDCVPQGNLQGECRVHFRRSGRRDWWRERFSPGLHTGCHAFKYR